MSLIIKGQDDREIQIANGLWVVDGVRTSVEHDSIMEYDNEHECDIPVGETCQRELAVELTLGEATIERKTLYHNDWHYGDGGGWRATRVHISTEPFAVLMFDAGDQTEHGGIAFVVSRQVHKDQLGMTPKIQKPKFVREARGRTTRRRGRPAWTRLTSLADLLAKSPKELVERYYRFFHYRTGRHFQFALAKDGDEIRGHHPEIVDCSSPEEALELMASALDNFESVWVRQGWANRVLYGEHFGYKPDVVDEEVARYS